MASTKHEPDEPISGVLRTEPSVGSGVMPMAMGQAQPPWWS